MMGHPGRECYTSIFMFGSDFKTHVDTKGTVRGYDGDCYSSALIWDIDDDDGIISDALDEARTLLKILEETGVDTELLRVYLSGSKGFHVVLPCAHVQKLRGNDVNVIVKNACKILADGINIDEGIYDKTRIFRVPNSQNAKTDLYKIPMTFKEAMSWDVEKMLSTAENQRELEFPEGSCDAEVLRIIIDQAKGQAEDDKGKVERSMSGSNLLSGIRSGFEEGNRNAGLTSVAGMLHARNFDDDFVEAIISAINDKGSKPLTSGDLDTIVRSVSRYQIQDEYVPPDRGNIITMQTAITRWAELRQRERNIATGYPQMDANIKLFDPGQVLMIAARSGCYKTASSMQICNNMAEYLGGRCLFASLEMTVEQVGYRASCITASKDGDNDDTFWQRLAKDPQLQSHCARSWSCTDIIDNDSLSLTSAENYFKMAQEESGGAYKVFLIDYFGLLNGTIGYEAISEAAKELKKMAKRLGTRVVMLVQLSRKAGDGTEEPFMDFLRDSGALEESADIILMLWRSRDDERRVHAKFAKNRDGKRDAKFDFIADGLFIKDEEYKEDNARIDLGSF